MEFNQMVNCMAMCFSADSRIFTRTNYPVESINDNEFPTMQGRHVKFDVTDYKDMNLTFQVKIMQLMDVASTPTKEMAITRIGENDKCFFQIDPEEWDNDLAVYLATVQQSGLPEQYRGKFARTLGKMIEMIESYRAKDRGDTLIGASYLLGNESISLFVQLKNSAVIIQIKQ